jgi:hypothetical protein
MGRSLHLFICCPLAKIIWCIVRIALIFLHPQVPYIRIFRIWLMGVSKKFKVHMQIGTCALLWARWNMGNNIIFSNAKAISFIHVIKLATYWIRM